MDTAGKGKRQMSQDAVAENGLDELKQLAEALIFADTTLRNHNIEMCSHAEAFEIAQRVVEDMK